MTASIEWKWKNDLIYMNVWKNDEKTAQFKKNVSRVTTYFMQLTSKRISFYEKNHALLVREPISFMLKQTFF